MMTLAKKMMSALIFRYQITSILVSQRVMFHSCPVLNLMGMAK